MLKGLVMVFSPKGGTRVFTRVIDADTGDAMFSLHLDEGLDAAAIMAAYVAYREEYSKAVNTEVVFHKVAAVDISDIKEKAALLRAALQKYATDPSEEAAAELERNFFEFQECGRILQERIDAAPTE